MIDTSNSGIPKGLCQCGCGELAPISPVSDRKKGMVKGQPLRFINGHYGAWMAKQDREPRFWAKVRKTVDCWLWEGRRNAQGYGDFQRTVFDRTMHTLAHRYAYERMVGPIPEGLVLDHLCRNRACVNPDHLEPVTHLENMRRGLRPPGGSHCIHGHEKTPENTRIYKSGARRCRVCERAADRQRRSRQGEEIGQVSA